MIRKVIGALALLAVLAGAAAAQEYPNRPIKFLHGFPPGGNVDIIARLLGNEMSKGLGQSIIIEAKPGVAGSLAAETVARSEPDGYTLLIVPSAHPAHGALSKNVSYKVVDDFEWISVASFYPFLICVRKDSRFQSLKQLIDEARKNSAGLTYGSAGVGSILHTTVELMANETKTKFLHVPYRGEAPAITGLLQGDIDFIAATSGPISPRIRSGEFRALAVPLPDGKPGPPRESPGNAAILAGVQKYSAIRVPALAIFATPHDMGSWVDRAPDPSKVREALAHTESLVTLQAKAFEEGVPGARVVRLERAHHYVFLSNEPDVLRELHAFIAGLRLDAGARP